MFSAGMIAKDSARHAARTLTNALAAAHKQRLIRAGARCSGIRATHTSSSHYFRNRYNGRPKATHLETEEARAQHPQDRACHRHSKVSPLPEHEAPASCLRGVRVLRWRTASRAEGSIGWRE